MKDINNQIDYWLGSAAHDLDVAEMLFEHSKNDWCLFIAHLVLEKTLKAFYIKNNNELPPRIHDLVRLSSLAGLQLEEEILEFLDAVNTFNISTRYPDEKLRFYQLCNYEFTKSNFLRIKELYKWLLQKI